MCEIGPWTAKSSKEFLILAFQWHRYRCVRTEHDSPLTNKSQEAIDWLYKLGRDLGFLQMDHAYFSGVMSNEQDRYTEGRPWSRAPYVGYWGGWGYWRSAFNPDTYRVLRKYIRQPHHEKKPKKEKPRRTGTIRSKYKRRPWAKNVKREAREKHRAMEREAMHNEDYESLDNYTYKRSSDHWNWD